MYGEVFFVRKATRSIADCRLSIGQVLVRFASLNFHSHRGFSPVTTQVVYNSEPFQRFALALQFGKKRLGNR